MKRRKNAVIAVEKAASRYQPDPHRRDRVIPSKKLYSRKAQSKAAPSDFSGF